MRDRALTTAAVYRPDHCHVFPHGGRLGVFDVTVQMLKSVYNRDGLAPQTSKSVYNARVDTWFWRPVP